MARNDTGSAGAPQVLGWATRPRVPVDHARQRALGRIRGIGGVVDAVGVVHHGDRPLPALLAAWAPDFLFALVGGYYIRKVPT